MCQRMEKGDIMEKIILIFALYILCGFFCVLMFFLTKKQIDEILQVLTEEPLKISPTRKTKLIIGALALVPGVNLIAGIYLFFADPVNLLLNAKRGS